MNRRKTAAKRKISQIVNMRLLVIMLMGLAITLLVLWHLQDRLASKEAEETLLLNISDVKEDIKEASDANMLRVAETVRDALLTYDNVTPDELYELCLDYEVDEIHLIDDRGIITTTTIPAFIGYDMRDGEQSAFFLQLLDGKTTSLVQEYGPISYAPELYKKYAGVTLPGGSFMQIGYEVGLFQQDLKESVRSVTGNRHVGKSGFVIIADTRGRIVSSRRGDVGESLTVVGLDPDELNENQSVVLEKEIYGERHIVLGTRTEGYYIIAAMPMDEVVLSRNASVIMISVMEAMVFFILFLEIFHMMRSEVIDNITSVNKSLRKITSGDLDTRVNVRDNIEFDQLSTDINTTVDTIRSYIEEAEQRMEAELSLAREIQTSTIPSVFPPYPNRKEFDIFGSMVTAKEVGGDFFDFCLVGDKLVFLIADVSGKGVPAAMFMMTAKTLIKNLALTGMAMEEIFTKANEELCANNDAEMFITAWIGCLDTKTGTITYSNAGHNPPLIRHRDGSFEYLQSVRGFVLAGMDGYRYRKGEIQMKGGDEIFLYTDGVTEATDKDGNLFGEDRLRKTLAPLGRRVPMEELCNTVKKAIDGFVGEAPQFDDITMLGIRYKGENTMVEMNIEATIENIPVVTEFVDAELERHHCPMKAQMQIDIAIDELFSNIARYAYNPETGPATVRVEVEEDPLSVIITFIDNGVPYNPLAHEDPDTTLSAEEREIGGLGILLVKKSMDAVEYSYKDGQNILNIRKNF